MNYELAKRLKDAGFPQYVSEHGSWFFDYDGSTGKPEHATFVHADPLTVATFFLVKAPNMIDLMNEIIVKDTWFRLFYFPNSKPERAEWVAEHGIKPFTGLEAMDNDKPITVSNKIPEVAMAELWLKLHDLL